MIEKIFKVTQLLLQKCSLQDLQQDPMGRGQLLSFRERGSTGRTERGDLAASLNTKNLQLGTVHSLAQRSPPETGTVSVLLKLAQSILSAQIEVLGSGLSIKEVPERSCFRCRGIFCKDTERGGEHLCLSVQYRFANGDGNFSKTGSIQAETIV